MGLVRAIAGSLSGTAAEQWKDFLTVPSGIWPTAALFPAVRVGTVVGPDSSLHGLGAVISNGSKVVVPEGFGLLTLQDGEVSGFTDEPGGYIWDTESAFSQSIFVGDSPRKALISQSWERFKFGGRPGTQQLALFVRSHELPGNRFGTQSPIYWDDAFLKTQVGAVAHGTYSITVANPITFVKKFVPAPYLQGQAIFDFTDQANPAANQIFSEIVSSLAVTFSHFTNSEARQSRIAHIQEGSIGFASTLASVVEGAYHWLEDRGLEISSVSLVGLDYDADTKVLLKAVQRADALSGNRSDDNLRASVAQGLESAGKHGGTEGILGVGIATNSMGLSALLDRQTLAAEFQGSSRNENSEAQDLVSQLEGLEQALAAGLINQDEYSRARSKALGLTS